MASYNYYQPTSTSTWSITHNLNSKHLAMDVMKFVSGSTFEKVMPGNVKILNDNKIEVTFTSSISGRARIVADNPD